MNHPTPTLDAVIAARVDTQRRIKQLEDTWGFRHTARFTDLGDTYGMTSQDTRDHAYVAYGTYKALLATEAMLFDIITTNKEA